MDLEINKEQFSNESFDPINYLNNLLMTGKPVTNTDLLSFKLKIIQKEINSEIDLYSNNVAKSGTTLQGDLNLVSNLQRTVKQKINNIFDQKENEKTKKNKEENSFNVKIIESNLKDIEKLKKAIIYFNK